MLLCMCCAVCASVPSFSSGMVCLVSSFFSSAFVGVCSLTTLPKNSVSSLDFGGWPCLATAAARSSGDIPGAFGMGD